MIQVDTFENITHVKTIITRMGQRLSVHLYLVDGMLVDTGPSRAREVLVPFLRDQSISQVVLTHHHEDHTGNAPWIQKQLGVPMYIHPVGIPFCQSTTDLPLYRRLFWGNREAFQPVTISEAIETDRHHYQVIHTPGHANDHVVLHDQQNGRLFSGDLFLTSRPKVMLRHESVPEHIESLRNVLKQQFDTVFCCHAGIVKQGKRMMESKLQHLLELQGEVLTLHEKGLSEKQICKKLYPKRDPLTYVSVYEMAPYHIVHSIIHDK